MIITIDGPTASGKSTVARLLAEQLGYMHLNSGLLYRALAYLLIKRAEKYEATPKKPYLNDQQKISYFKKVVENYPELLDVQSIEELAAEEKLHYRFVKDKGAEVFIRHENITPYLKTILIDETSSIVATNAAVRQVLLAYQRELANKHNVVADGRDCGTVVFPHAQYKFFLTASLDVRAQRWHQGIALDQGATLDPRNSRSQESAFNGEGRQGDDMQPGSKQLSFEECKQIVAERDERDETRKIAPLKPAPDVYIIDSSKMTVQEVITEMTNVIGII